MYALVKIQGKQYKVKNGQTFLVDCLPGEEGSSVDFETVLLLRDNEKTQIGFPYVKGARVRCQIVGQQKGPKIIVYRYKRRKDYERKMGHRQSYSVVKVEEISGL